MSSENYQAILDLIYGVIAEPQKWPEVLVRIADHLGASGGMLLHIPKPGHGLPLQINGRISEERSEIFRRHYPWNLWSQAMQNVPFGKAVSADSLIEPGAIQKTGFYADVLQPEGHIDILNIRHRAMTHNGGTGGFGFTISRQQADHREAGVRRLQRLAPHLNRSLDTALALGPLTDGTRQLARVLELMPNAALLLDGGGRIIHTNCAADVLLRENDGLILDHRNSLHLSAPLAAEAILLAKTLAQALAVAKGEESPLGEPVRLSRPSGEPPLLAIPVPLPPPVFSLWELTGTARVLVLILDPAMQSKAALSAIETVFGMTAAEARVAALIGCGLTGPQVATRLGISPSTVKTHLKRCFEKMDVHSQVDLARLLAVFPTDPTGRFRTH